MRWKERRRRGSEHEEGEKGRVHGWVRRENKDVTPKFHCKNDTIFYLYQCALHVHIYSKKVRITITLL